MFKFFSLIWIFFTIAGCASVGVTRLGGYSYPPKSSDCNLLVFTDVKSVTRKYVEICLIDSRTGQSAFDNKTVQGAIEAAMPKACEAGCDAIIVQSGDTEGANLMGWGSGRAIITGIKFIK